VRGREHHARRGLPRTGGAPVRAVQAGHLDVEEDHVGRQFVDQAQGFDAVGARPITFSSGQAGELLFEVGEQMRFVVGEQGAWSRWVQGQQQARGHAAG
jgi:hypothetical protein